MGVAYVLEASLKKLAPMYKNLYVEGEVESVVVVFFC